MAVLLPCFLLTFVSEMGDKTQLLALVLTTRFRRPWTILAGFLVASVASLGLAAWLGGALAARIGPSALHWGIAISFFGFAAWMLVPEKDEAVEEVGRAGAFWTTCISVFLAEMGDKAQVAVVGLSAHYAAPVWVTAGAVSGMLAADGLAIVFGGRLMRRMPMAWIRKAASALFALFGLLTLMKA